MSTFSYSLVPQCLVEATEAALTNYLTPFLFLSGPRSGATQHKVKIKLIHETALALAVFQHLLMHPKLLEKDYDVRWEHELKKPKGGNVPRADLFLSPQQGKGGVKTYVEVGRLSKEKIASDARKLVKYRPNDSLFLLMLDLDPPESRTDNDAMHRRMVQAAKATVSGATLATSENAARLLNLPITLLNGEKPRVGFGLLKIMT